MKWNCVLVVFLISIWGNVGNGQKSPTVFPADPFNPVKDAAALQNAMRGFGTDEQAINEILARRSLDQRLEIAKSYKTSYGKDLINDLTGELSGSLRNAIVSLFYPLPQLYAKELYDATYGIGTDEQAIIQILTTQSNDEMKTISQLYQQKYGNTLEADLKGDTSGSFQRLCVSLIQGNRNENQGVDQNAILDDAAVLSQPGADESTFNPIFVTRSYQQLLQIFTEYEKLAKITIEKRINKLSSTSTASGFLAIVQWIKSKENFYAERLYNAMNGYVSINDKTLTRIVVSRSELDLGAIKIAFQAKYGKSLESRIKETTSGDYRDLLVLLVSS